MSHIRLTDPLVTKGLPFGISGFIHDEAQVGRGYRDSRPLQEFIDPDVNFYSLHKFDLIYYVNDPKMCASIDMQYPGVQGNPTHVEVDLTHVRSVSPLRVHFDFPTNEWVIEAQVYDEPSETDVPSEDEGDGYHEAARIPAWHTPGVQRLARKLNILASKNWKGSSSKFLFKLGKAFVGDPHDHLEGASVLLRQMGWEVTFSSSEEAGVYCATLLPHEDSQTSLLDIH